jgi:hypothetical protein
MTDPSPTETDNSYLALDEILGAQHPLHWR